MEEETRKTTPTRNIQTQRTALCNSNYGFDDVTSSSETEPKVKIVIQTKLKAE